MGRNFSNIILCLFASGVIGSFASCSNELDSFEEDWNFANDEEPVTFATRSAGGSGDDQGMQYPDLSYIQNAPGFKSQAEAAWDSTMNALTDSTRQEFGFMIYWINNTIKYGPITGGPVVSGCTTTRASWIPNLSTRYDQICAAYHCHTPIPKCYPSDASRPTGVHDGDNSWANDHNIPVLVEDFEENPVTYHADFKTRNHKITESDLKRRDI